MGQYYKAFVRNSEQGVTFNPQSAIYMTRHGLERVPDERVPFGSFDDEDSYFGCFSGMKLTEHSWVENDFVNGVMELIERNPSMVAWVGDYADEDYDFDGRYTKEVYACAWYDDCHDSPFEMFPDTHKDGYIVNHSKGEYIDLAKYVEANEKDGWCVHPLPLMTAIGNGRGGGDYRGCDEDVVGRWAMDTIEYAHEKPTGFTEISPRFES